MATRFNLEVREALLKAANLIQRRGLAKHQQQDHAGRLCALGAINVATKGDAFGLGNRVAQVAARRLARHLWNTPYGIISWNNSVERTKSHVVSALRKAAS